MSSVDGGQNKANIFFKCSQLSVDVLQCDEGEVIAFTGDGQKFINQLSLNFFSLFTFKTQA